MINRWVLACHSPRVLRAHSDEDACQGHRVYHMDVHSLINFSVSLSLLLPLNRYPGYGNVICISWLSALPPTRRTSASRWVHVAGILHSLANWMRCLTRVSKSADTVAYCGYNLMVNEGGNATLKDSQLLTNFLSDRVELIVISSRPFRLAAQIYIYEQGH